MRLLHHQRVSIRYKMFLLVLGLAWPPLILVSVLGLVNLDQARTSAVQSVTDTLQQQAEDTLEQRALDKAQRYDAVLAGVERQVEGVAGAAALMASSTPGDSSANGRVWVAPAGLTPDSSRAHAATIARARALIPLLRTAVHTNELVSLGYIGLEEGGVLAFDHDIVDVLSAIQPFDPRARSWYTAARAAGHTVWVDTYVDANTKRLTTTCAAPVYDARGTFIGVVGFDLLLDTLQQDLLQFNSGESGYAFLMGNNGKVLVRPDMQAGALAWNRPFASEDLLATGDAALHAVIVRMTEGRQGVERLLYQGGDVYMAYAPIGSAGWSVGMVVPQAAVVQPAEAVGTSLGTRQQRLRADIMVVFVIAMAGIALAGILLTRQITRPLRKLRYGVQHITAGHLDHQIEDLNSDEIGELAHAFNAMGGSLRQKVAEFEANLRHLAMLNEVSNHFKTIMALPELIDAIPHAVCANFSFDRAALYMLDGDVLRVASVCFGPNAGEQERAFMDAANSEPTTLHSTTIEADVLRSGQAVIVSNPWSNPRVSQAKQRVSLSDSYVQVPILGQNEKIVGLISADYHYQRRDVSASDAAQLLTYASMVGLTLDNASLYEELERKVAQRTDELRVALDRAREADRLKTRFLAAISHELRTPLNAIVGFSTILVDGMRGPLHPEQREDVKTIYDNGQFLLHLINELLDLARIESGKLDLRKASLHVAELVQDVAATTQGLLRDRPVKLLVAVPPDLPPVYADRPRLRQILLNLVSNAVKFTDSGVITVSARSIPTIHEATHGHHRPPCVAISVRDTGRGIEPALLPMIFEEFRQVHHGAAGVNGSGLGLAITRGLVEAHGGRIWAESAPGHGTIITFTLLVAAAPTPAPAATEP